MWAKVEQWRQEQLEAGGTALSSHNAVEFVDIGSGVGGVRLMAALMAGAEATGVGLSFECHNAARKWHLTCARAIPASHSSPRRHRQACPADALVPEASRRWQGHPSPGRHGRTGSRDRHSNIA